MKNIVIQEDMLNLEQKEKTKKNRENALRDGKFTKTFISNLCKLSFEIPIFNIFFFIDFSTKKKISVWFLYQVQLSSTSPLQIIVKFSHR